MHINKLKQLRLVSLGAIICLHGCGSDSSTPMTTPTTPENIIKTVTNGNLVFELIFMDKLSLQNNSEKNWSRELQQPYIPKPLEDAVSELS
jgi:hypothetical protein